MPGVFLSHSSKDKPFVGRLAIDLTIAGIPVWLDTWEMGPGDSLIDHIYGGIDHSSFLVIVVSADSVKSKWVQKELKAAIVKEDRGEGPFVLPLRLDDVELPIAIADKIYVNFYNSYLDGFERLLSFLRKRGAHLQTIPLANRVFPVVFSQDIYLDEIKLRDAIVACFGDQEPALKPEQVWIQQSENYEKLRRAFINRLDNLRSESYWTYKFEQDMQLYYRRVTQREAVLSRGIADTITHWPETGYPAYYLPRACHNFAKLIRSEMLSTLYYVQNPDALAVSDRSPFWFHSPTSAKAIEALLGVSNPQTIDVGVPTRIEHGLGSDTGAGISVQVSEQRQREIHEFHNDIGATQPLAAAFPPDEITEVILPQIIYKLLTDEDPALIPWSVTKLHCGLH